MFSPLRSVCVAVLVSLGALSFVGCRGTGGASPEPVVGPSITAQPVSLTVNAGAAATFTVLAAGTEPLTYQWQKAGTAISGAIAATYPIAAAQSSDTGSYTVVVTNAVSSVTSTAAILTVNVAPAIGTQPASLTVTAGAAASFTVAATGSGTLSYQWKKDGTAISGATAATYPIAAAQSSDAGSYTVVVTNTLGGTATSTTSTAATLTVNVAPSITTQPASQTVAAGAAATFTVVATGTAPLTYQWKKAGTAISGATAATYAITAVQGSDAGSFTVVVTNVVSSVTSSAATLAVNVAPTIGTQPASLTVTAGAAASFTVAATGSGTLSYQWQKGGTAISGATAATHAITAAQSSDAGSYTVVVTNTLGGTTTSTTSTAATLTVNVAPTIGTQPASLAVTAGAAASFTVAATGSGTLSYQWKKDGTAISGATAATYSIAAAQSSDAGSYTVVVTNSINSVTSNAATLTVNPAPPATPTVQTATYVTTGRTGIQASTTDQGTGITYVWTITGGTLTAGQGTIAATYTAGTVGTLTAAVAVTNGAGTRSGSATATVVPAPMAELALPTSIHLGDAWMQASVPVQAGMTYLWTVTPGTATATINSGRGTGAIAFSNDVLATTHELPTTAFAAAASSDSFQISADVQNLASDHATATRVVSIDSGTWVVKNGGPAMPSVGTTITLLDSGRVLLVGGSEGDISINLTTKAQLFDPATGKWVTTGPLGAARWTHSATRLLNGKVLVAGGIGATGPTVSAELYDPGTGVWTATGNLVNDRAFHNAILLPSGKVLVTGGTSLTGYQASAELYDPGTGTWTATSNMAGPRPRSAITLLGNGKVLVAGGNNSTVDLKTAELFDPAEGSWKPTGSMGTVRSGFLEAIRLGNGKVLIAGGDDGTGSLESAELYDPALETWSPTTGMGTTRARHSVTLLASGKVLVAGGDRSASGGASCFDATALIYDPATTLWTATGGLAEARSFHSAVLLASGQVLAVGGANESRLLTSAETYDPTAGTWSQPTGLGTPRLNTTIVRLSTEKVLAIGGRPIIGNPAYPVATTELCNPATGLWTATGSLNTARELSTATLLNNSKVLVAGGSAQSGYPTTTELYDFASGTWSLTGSLGTGRFAHTATLLSSGKVLVAGGTGQASYLASAELYDPATGLWSATGSLNVARSGATATLLANGKVLVNGGGASASTALASAELYDPATGLWTATGSMTAARRDFSSTLLANGKVLAIGGYGPTYYQPFASTETYDPATGIWSTATSLSAGRSSHNAVRLLDGRVMVIGGFLPGIGSPATELTYGMYYLSTEIFNPGTGTWSLGANVSLGSPAGVVRMSDGTVVCALGGNTVTEVYLPGPFVANPPGAPTNLAATAGDGQVSLSWTAATAATTYQVDYYEQSAPEAVHYKANLAGTSTTVTGLLNNVPYVFSVNAVNGSGTTAGTPATVSATPAPAVTLVSIATSPTNFSLVARSGNQQLTATGTYSDGSTANISATVAWSSSDASKAVMDNDRVRPLSAGSAQLTAHLAGVSSNAATVTVTAYSGAGSNTTTNTTSTSTGTGTGTVRVPMDVSTVIEDDTWTATAATITQQGTHGTATLNSRVVSYQPGHGYSGTDTVVVQITQVSYSLQAIYIGPTFLGYNLVINTNTATKTITISVE